VVEMVVQMLDALDLLILEEEVELVEDPLEVQVALVVQES
tara:strand:- start:69 stop:188 length:120 start_codon:yes stop_codon:yes gene_type:complete